MLASGADAVVSHLSVEQGDIFDELLMVGGEVVHRSLLHLLMILSFQTDSVDHNLVQVALSIFM